MNCREFLFEFEERRQLSEPAQLHLNDCPDCVKTSGEQTRVWQMIDDLTRVDAPNDFDFRVKAKIANAKPADFRTPRFLPVLRYVLPLGLIVLVAGLLAFNTSFFFGSNNSSPVAEVISPMSKENIAPINSFSSNQIAAANTINETVPANAVNANVSAIENNQKEQLAGKLPSRPRANAPKNSVENDSGGSRDFSVTRPTEKYPLGLSPNQPVEPLSNGSNANSLSGEGILQILGVEITADNGNLKVKSVREKSPAERSEVKPGDVIEAIDGVKISAESLRTKQIGVKKLTVVRGAEKIEITLKY